MSAWQQQSNGAVFPGMLDASNQANAFDPSMNNMFAGNGYNQNQFNSPASQQRMPNGTINPQSAFQNQTYNVGSVVPSKRSREDGMGMSPAAPQNNALNVPRSQTPMQQQPPTQQGTPFQPGPQFPTPYQHLHQASANATPSPTMQNQQFRRPEPPQRVTTASPAPYNHMQNMPGQMSPSPSLHNNNQQMSPQIQQPQSFSPNLGNGQGFGQNFGNHGGGGTGGMATNMTGAGMNMNAQMQAQLQQRQYQQRLLQQQHRMQAQGMAAQRPTTSQPGQMFNTGGAQGMGMPNGQQQQQGQQQHQHQQQQQQQHSQHQHSQQHQHPSQQTPQQQQQQSHPQQPQQQQSQLQQQGQQQQAVQQNQAEKARQWLAVVQAQNQAAGRPFNPSPTICGRPVNLYMIWWCIAGLGGSAALNARNMWPGAAAKLGFPNNSNAVQELRQIFDVYLSTYERQYMLAKQTQKQQAAQAAARQMAGMGGPMQASPTKQMQSGLDVSQNPMLQVQQQSQQQTQQQQMHPNNQIQPSPSQRSGSLSMQTDIPASAMPGIQPQVDIGQLKRTSSLGKVDIMPPPPQQNASPMMDTKQMPPGPNATVKREASISSVKPIVEDTEYKPTVRQLETYGGYDLGILGPLTNELVRRVPDVPSVFEMGVIDIRALTLSLQSGIHSEVRHAIDNLVQVTVDPRIMLELDKCEDLVDVIVDCAEEQVDSLAEEATEVSDAVDLISYEDVVRSARTESEDLQDIHPVGSVEHEMERAASRLIGLTTILRNLSFNELNHPFLATTSVLALLSNSIRLLGTRNMLLRSHTNVLDFYKDCIIFLSNIAQALELPSRDDALHFLHFLLVFAPQPAPTVTNGKDVRFMPFHPLLHKYLPHAVDSLAKILARTEPNRSLYRTIFSTSPSSDEDITPDDLLTRTFGLALSVLPDRTKSSLSTTQELRLVETRKALLTQGMLAADVLASLVRSPSSSDSSDNSINLAREWLESDCRWPASLLRMTYVLSTSDSAKGAPQQRQTITRPDGRTQTIEPEGQTYGTIIHRGLAMLRRLVEKAAMGPSRKAKQRSAVTNGTDRAAGAFEDGDADGGAQQNGDADSDDDENDDSERARFAIKGDPIPHRETVLGALLLQGADKESVRMMGRLYDMVC